tara:strand:+ start:41 stop:868 length:828 start_codon:yes stop_codon:yes gene_type:complete
MFKKFFRSVRKVAKNIAPIAAPIAGFAFGAPAGIGIGALLGQYGGKEGALRAAALGGIGGLAGNYAQTGQLLGARGVLGKGGVGLKEGAKNLFMGRLPTGMDPSVAAGDLARSTRTGGIVDLFGKIPGGKTLLTSLAINAILNPRDEEDNTTQDEPVADAFKDLDVADIQYPDPTPVFVAEGGIMSLDKGGTVDDYGGIEAFKRKNGEIAGPGTMTSDDIPAMLSDGEFVTKAISVLGAGVKHGGAKTKDEARKKGAEFFYNQQRELEPFGKKVV